MFHVHHLHRCCSANLNLEGNFKNLGDAGVLALSLAAAPRLHTLNLSGCAQVTSAALMQIFTSCHVLRSVDLSNVPAFTDREARSLVDVCPALCALRADCSKLSAGALVHVVTRVGARLEALSLQYCRTVTDAVLQALLMNCTNVQDLNFYGCTALTSDGVSALQTPLPRLRLLDISLCNAINDRTLLHILAHAPALQWLALFHCAAGTSAVRASCFFFFPLALAHSLISVRSFNCAFYLYILRVHSINVTDARASAHTLAALAISRRARVHRVRRARRGDSARDHAAPAGADHVGGRRQSEARLVGQCTG